MEGDDWGWREMGAGGGGMVGVEGLWELEEGDGRGWRGDGRGGGRMGA